MIEGQRGALHRHTLCILSGAFPHDGERCTIVAFDQSSGMWRVKLVDPRWKGKELQVPEAALRVQFCLLPSSLGKEKFFVQCASELLEGCGRNLIVEQHVKVSTHASLCVRAALH